MIETLFASRLTTTSRVSSEVSAMVVEWVPRLTRLFWAAPGATRLANSTASTIGEAVERSPNRAFAPRRNNDRMRGSAGNPAPENHGHSPSARPEFFSQSLLLTLGGTRCLLWFWELLLSAEGAMGARWSQGWSGLLPRKRYWQKGATFCRRNWLSPRSRLPSFRGRRV